MKYVLVIVNIPILILIPTTKINDIAKTAAFALLTATFFLFLARYYYPDADFLAIADALAHGRLSGTELVRDIGFPLMLMLSGFPWHHSLIGITLIHAAMAVIIPVFVYLSVRPVAPWAAYYAGLLTTASLAPFYYLKWIFHDQTFIFFLAMTAWALCVLVETKRPHYLFWLTGALLFTSLTRPAGNFLYPCIVVIALWLGPRNLKHWVISIVAFVSLMAAYLYARHQIAGAQPAVPSYSGQQMFYSLYRNANQYSVVLSDELGPNMKTIVTHVREDLLPEPRSSPELRRFIERNDIPKEFVENYFYKFSADELTRRMFEFPNSEYFEAMSTMLVHSRGFDTDRIFLGAALEIFRANPLYAFKFTLRNMWHFIFDPGYGHSRYNELPFHKQGRFFPMLSYAHWTEPIWDRVAKELQFDTYVAQPVALQHSFQYIQTWWNLYFNKMVTITNYLLVLAWATMVLGFLGLIWKAPTLQAICRISHADILMPPTLAASTLFLYNVAVTSAVAEPAIRYVYMLWALRLLIAGFGLAALFAIAGSFGTGGLNVARRLGAGTLGGSGWASTMAARLHRQVAWIAQENKASNALLARAFAPRLVVSGLTALMIVSFGSWALYMILGVEQMVIPAG